MPKTSLRSQGVEFQDSLVQVTENNFVAKIVDWLVFCRSDLVKTIFGWRFWLFDLRFKCFRTSVRQHNLNSVDHTKPPVEERDEFTISASIGKSREESEFESHKSLV